MSLGETAPTDDQTQSMDDVCTLSMVQRIAAMLDLDVGKYAEGDALPHGWHVGLFGIHTRDSQLRPDGVAIVGFHTDRYDIGAFDEHLAAAGFTLEHRFATWDLRPWRDAACARGWQNAARTAPGM